MKKNEIHDVIADSGWKAHQLVYVLQQMGVKADKRRVSDTIHCTRINPQIQEAIAKVLLIDAEILFGKHYWKYHYDKMSQNSPMKGE